MRMWMLNPRSMCRNHLLGEHCECHMLAGSLKKGRGVSGFIEKGLLEPQNLEKRHAELATEMRSRGYSHKSPICSVKGPSGFVRREESAVELARRCRECRKLAKAVGRE